MKTRTIRLENSRKVPAVQLAIGEEPRELLHKLNLADKEGAIAVVGGAAGFDKPEFLEIKKAVGLLLVELADVASDNNLVVIDGGTRSGYMEILGETCAIRDHDFALVGVAPLGKITWNGRGSSLGDWLHWLLIWLDFDPGSLPNTQDRVSLQPDHTAFVLVEAENWGDEVEALARVTYELAGSDPSVEVLINGGNISRKDVLAYTARGGKLIVIEGTGRFADELAAAYHAGSSPDPEIQKLVSSGQVSVFHIDQPPGKFRELLAELGKWEREMA